MARIPKNNQALWAEMWNHFCDHKYKATVAITDTYPDEAREHPELIVSAAMWQGVLAPVAERIRQYGLYADFHAVEKRWLSPIEVSQDDVARWLNWVEIVLPKLESIQQMGLCSSKALKIQQEVIGALNVGRPKQSKLTDGNLQTMFASAPDAVREYFRRLVEADILPHDADIKVAGTDIRALLETSNDDALN